MNKEELELVIQAIEKLGAAGQSAFTWWLVINFLTSLITPTSWVIAAYVIINAIKAMVCYTIEQDSK